MTANVLRILGMIATPVSQRIALLPSEFPSRLFSCGSVH
jgi:hypothetical protein